tara:strand:+ start:10681 stop:11841 length:1161 start_codon:yes stop_codon:yes gene_type:complete
MKSKHPYPIAKIGLIGGGQLGRMIVEAAKKIGCECIVLDPVENSPAGQIAAKQILGSHHDEEKINQLASETDFITFELENINTKALQRLENEGHKIYPSPSVLKTIQDKLLQKRFLSANDIPSAEFSEIERPSIETFKNFGFPLVQKLRLGGYDGQGVVVMKSEADYQKNINQKSLIEKFIDAKKEIAIIVARSSAGEVKTFPPVEMSIRSEENVLDMLFAPAGIKDEIKIEAETIAIKTIESLQGIGVFGIEMFIDQNEKILVNEIAPRPHNSGHHTIEANITNQFEQHLRAILGLPLGNTDTLISAAMVNLFGAEGEFGAPVLNGLSEVLEIPGVHLHLYGKAATRPFRKMGHITILDSDMLSAKEKALRVKEIITIESEEDNE